MRISDWSSDVCSSDLHVDMDGGMFRNAQEVGVQRTVGHGVESHILGEGADLLSAHFDEDDRIEEMAGAEQQIGRASGRERVCQYGEISVVAVSLKQTNTRETTMY